MIKSIKKGKVPFDNPNLDCTKDIQDLIGKITKKEN